MKIDVVTIFPEIIEQSTQCGVLGQALNQNILSIHAHQLRNYSVDAHRKVDDRPFGGGDGMVMNAEVIFQAIKNLKLDNTHVIYMSPQGKPLNDQRVRELSEKKHLVVLCGRYGGVDQRIMPFIDEEISVGDYVVSGGEFPALILIDAVSRMIPGVLGHQDSKDIDSFSNGRLEAPHYTRPQLWREFDVPEVLMSGHHLRIQEWRDLMGWLVTIQKRPDLIKDQLKVLKSEEIKKLKKQILQLFNSLSQKEIELNLFDEKLNERIEELFASKNGEY